MITRASRADRITPRVPISAREWNEVFEEFRTNRPLVVGANTSGGWYHPWRPFANWNATSGQWEITIKPGFVGARDGKEVEVTIDLDSAPQLTIDRSGLDPDILVGETRVRAYLTEEPSIPLPEKLKAIGPDAHVMGEGTLGEGGVFSFSPVPEFFQALGVGNPPAVSLGFDGSETLVNDTVDRSQERLLRSFDIMLHQERIGTTSDWTLGDGSDGVVARFDVTYANSDYRRNPYVTLVPEWVPRSEVDILDQISGDWQDEPIDELRIARGYLLSPPGADYGSDPDPSWTPFFKNYVFWNLEYSTNLLPTQEDPNLIEVNLPPLAGGVVDNIFESLIADNNDAIQAASELLNNNVIQGRFWTI